MNTKTASVIIGIVFIAVGLLGFVPNPIIANSADAIFHADAVHSSVHIVSGVLFLVFALAIPARVVLFMKVFAVVYFLLGIMGLFTIGSDGMARLLGFLHVNGPDNYLHIALGILIFLASTLPAPDGVPDKTRNV
ncbi:MAG TPA: DUF4383 domain-containing protein [Chryseosolibacter sp.]